MSACRYVDRYLHVYACMRACVHVCMCAHTRVYIYIYVCVYAWIRLYIYKCTDVPMTACKVQVHIQLPEYTHNIYIYIHIYICICIHIQICTNTHMRVRVQKSMWTNKNNHTAVRTSNTTQRCMPTYYKQLQTIQEKHKTSFHHKEPSKPNTLNPKQILQPAP